MNWFDLFSTHCTTLLAGNSFFGIDLFELLKTVGYIGIAAIIFAESGLLIGFFLPGDSLLFTAGVLSSTAGAAIVGSNEPVFNIVLLAIICFVAAVAGDSVGYWFGNKTGPRIFNKEESLLFSTKNIMRAQAFYEKHGGKTIILARFIPIVRTFAPIVAGVGRMRYATFLAYNVLGGFLWAVGVSLAGYILGQSIKPEDVDKLLIPIIVLIILISIAPTAYHILKERENRQKIGEFLRNLRQSRKSKQNSEMAEIPVEVTSEKR